MPETYEEETRRLLENRKRNAEIRRAQQIKKRNTMLAGIGGILVVILLIIVICISCSSGKSKKEEQTTTAPATTEAVETTTPEETTTLTAMYTTDTLNLREEPNTDATIITQIKAGKKVEVISEEGSWCKIQRGDNVGYVMKKYLSYENTLD